MFKKINDSDNTLGKPHISLDAFSFNFNQLNTIFLNWGKKTGSLGSITPVEFADISEAIHVHRKGLPFTLNPLELNDNLAKEVIRIQKENGKILLSNDSDIPSQYQFSDKVWKEIDSGHHMDSIPLASMSRYNFLGANLVLTNENSGLKQTILEDDAMVMERVKVGNSFRDSFYQLCDFATINFAPFKKENALYKQDFVRHLENTDVLEASIINYNYHQEKNAKEGTVKIHARAKLYGSEVDFSVIGTSKGYGGHKPSMHFLPMYGTKGKKKISDFLKEYRLYV